MKNVVIVPHLGSATVEVREEMASIVVDNIVALREGRRPPNIVNPEVLSSLAPRSGERVPERSEGGSGAGSECAARSPLTRLAPSVLATALPARAGRG